MFSPYNYNIIFNINFSIIFALIQNLMFCLISEQTGINFKVRVVKRDLTGGPLGGGETDA